MARRQCPLLELADLRPESPGVLVSRRHASPDLSAAWRVTPPAGGARCLRFDCPGARTGLLAGGRGGYATVRPGGGVEDQRQTGPGGQGTHLPGAGSAGVRDRAIGPGRGTSGGISAIGTWEAWEPDAQGQLWSEVLGLGLVMRGREVRAVTREGELLRTPPEAEAEIARLRAALERLTRGDDQTSRG